MFSRNFNSELLESLHSEGETANDIECIIIEKIKPFDVDEPHNEIIKQDQISEKVLKENIIDLNGKVFIAWTKNFIYFLVYFDMAGGCHVCSIPRHPNDKIVPESFAGGV